MPARQTRQVRGAGLPLRPEEGGRQKPFNGYRPQFFFRTTDLNGQLSLEHGVEMVMPGDTGTMTIELGKSIAMSEGLGFAVREGDKTVADGTATKLLDQPRCTRPRRWPPPRRPRRPIPTR